MIRRPWLRGLITRLAGPDSAHDEQHARMDIRELTCLYSRALDRREFELLETVFTQDAVVLGYEGEPDVGEPLWDARGRENVMAFMRGVADYIATTHFLGNQLIEFQGAGEGATGETYNLAYHLYDKGGVRRALLMSVRYQDEFAREDGRWKIRKRIIGVDWQSDLPLVLD